jgi:hypothetical protein
MHGIPASELLQWEYRPAGALLKAQAFNSLKRRSFGLFSESRAGCAFATEVQGARRRPRLKVRSALPL